MTLLSFSICASRKIALTIIRIISPAIAILNVSKPILLINCSKWYNPYTNYHANISFN